MTDPHDPPLGDLDAVADRLSLTATADDTCIDLGHELIERLWSRHPEVTGSVRLRFETAVIEILANVVEHAFGPPAPEPVLDDGTAALRELTLTVGVESARVHAVLSDNGNPPTVDLSEVSLPDEDAVSGRGLAMAELVTSALSVHRIGDHNVWRLRCDPE